MKKILILCCAMMLGMDCAWPEPKKPAEKEEPYDIFLLIGQSNMAGRGALLPEDLEPIPGVWLLDDRDRPAVASNPLNRYSTVRKELPLQKMGPGYAFARETARRSGRKILLVVNALGNSSVGQWRKDAPLVTDESSIACREWQLYEEIVVRARHARRYGTIRAILWHQGEANTNAGSLPRYLEVLGRIVEDLREDLKQPDLPFIVGELGGWRADYAAFNKMLHSVTSYIPHSAWVSAEGCTSNPDRVHFSREGQLLLGSRYADKVLEICYGL